MFQLGNDRREGRIDQAFLSSYRGENTGLVTSRSISESFRTFEAAD